MPHAPGYRYDLSWSRKDLAVLIATCALAAALLAGRDRAGGLRPGPPPGVDHARVRAAEEKINPNTAGVASLRRCPMIGRVRAEAIVEYRRRHGPAPFRAPADLMKVRGIGRRAVERIAPFLDLPRAARGAD